VRHALSSDSQNRPAFSAAVLRPPSWQASGRPRRSASSR